MGKRGGNCRYEKDGQRQVHLYKCVSTLDTTLAEYQEMKTYMQGK